MSDVIDICSFHLDPRGMVPSERVHMEEWAGVEPGGAACWTAIGMPALFKPGMTSQYRFIADLSPGPRIGRVSASIHWKDTPNAGASRKAEGTLIGIAGEVASDAEGNVTTPGDIRSQAHYALARISEVVELHGSAMDRVVEVTSFHKDPRAAAIVMEVGREWFDPGRGPAWTAVGVTGLWNPGYLHEIYALAVL
jgi:enamine deaminase RidA (YjgF/YER057c/UK114 family)